MEHDPGYYLQQQDRRMLQKPVAKAPWRDRDQVEHATLEYVDWFNHRRPLEPIRHTTKQEGGRLLS